VGRVSNCAASSRPTRRSRRICRAESFASNFLKKATHLAHVSVPAGVAARHGADKIQVAAPNAGLGSTSAQSPSPPSPLSTEYPTTSHSRAQGNQSGVNMISDQTSRCSNIVACGWWSLGVAACDSARGGSFQQRVSRAGRQRCPIRAWAPLVAHSPQRCPLNPRNPIAPCAFSR